MPNNVALALDVALQSAAVADGNGTAIACGGLAAIGVQVSGLVTATINWEATIDGNWVAGMVTNRTTNTDATTTTGNGLFRFDCAGCDQFRARISGYSAGTI